MIIRPVLFECIANRQSDAAGEFVLYYVLMMIPTSIQLHPALVKADPNIVRARPVT